MGQLPVEQLVDLIEGKPEQNAKKQVGLTHVIHLALITKYDKTNAN